MPLEDLEAASEAERLGDFEGSNEAAILHYCEALRLLMPTVAASVGGESYDGVMEVYQRLHDKVHARRPGTDIGNLTKSSRPTPEPLPPTLSVPAAPVSPPPAESELTVYKFQPGMTIRVKQTFKDFFDKEVLAGEVLHLLETSYFPYESGHSLKFAEKTIYLSGDDPDENVIISNRGNAWFELVAE